MDEKSAFLKWILGPRQSYMNLVFIVYCLFSPLVLIWNQLAVHQRPFLFYLIEALGGLSGGVGVLLFLNDRRIVGIVAILGQIGSYILNHFSFGTSLSKNLFFWIFCLAFVGMTIIAILGFCKRRHRDKPTAVQSV